MNQNLIKLVFPTILFVILTFIHFVSDWIFQSHSEAMIKHDHFWIRTKHCFIYTILFWPFFFWIDLSWSKIIISSLVLFISHHIEDTYLPVFYWAKYIRKPPEMSEYSEKVKHFGSLDKYIGFKEFNQTTLGKILSIVVDQLVHLSFLWVVAYIIIK